jgi:hypothetical protein
MTNWNELSDAERDALNEEAAGECRDKLRAAEQAYPGCELAEYQRYVESLLLADIAENERLIRKAQRSRATQWDRRSAELAARHNEGLSLQLGLIWDVEI